MKRQFYIVLIVTLILAACRTHAFIPNKLAPFGKDVAYSDGDIVRESYLLNFTNKEIDYNLDLHTFGARYYTADFPRFISPDPVSGRLMTPITWNRYLYCWNDPVNLIDPDGKAPNEFSHSHYKPMKRCIFPEAGSGGGGGSVGKGIGAKKSMPGKPGITSRVITNVKNTIKGVFSRSNTNIGSSTPSSKTGVKRTGRAKNKMSPDPGAQGDHTVIKGEWGDIKGYEIYTSNPKNRSGFDSAKRVDITGGGPHTNKVTGQDVPTPHVHGKDILGGVRPARPDEIPKQGK
jgi:RHS repeat-associated protein